jgi:MOSC domain-containing protein YiiM
MILHVYRRKPDCEKQKFSRDEVTGGEVVCFDDLGLANSADWHRSGKEVKDDGCKDPSERAVLVQTEVNVSNLQSNFPSVAGLLSRPAMAGENLFVTGADFSSERLCVGDVICVVRENVVRAKLVVTSPRLPCSRWDKLYKLQTTGQNTETVRGACASRGLGGFFCRSSGGDVQVGDKLTISARPNPRWPLARVARLCYGGAKRFSSTFEFQGSMVLRSISEIEMHAIALFICLGRITGANRFAWII